MIVNANPEVLKWARESAGLNIEQATKKLKFKDPEKLGRLEFGNEKPSRKILSDMSKIYRRSLLVFYLKKIPITSSKGNDFRTLPEDYRPDLNFDSFIRDIHIRQSILKEAIEEEEDFTPISFKQKINFSMNVITVSKIIQELFEFTHNDIDRIKDPDELFKFLRNKIESKGIFVILAGNLGSHHTDIDVVSFRGVAIADEAAPFIIINDHDSHFAWSFTLLHELVHILLGESGISNMYFEQKIEKFCNDIAAEILLPETINLPTLENINNLQKAANLINEFAKQKNVSSSMVAYRLYQKGIIKKELWEKLAAKFKILWEQSQISKKEKRKLNKEKGPDYYIVRRHRIGGAIIKTVKQMLQSGNLTTIKASKVLGVKSSNLSHLFENG